MANPTDPRTETRAGERIRRTSELILTGNTNRRENPTDRRTVILKHERPRKYDGQANGYWNTNGWENLTGGRTELNHERARKSDGLADRYIKNTYKCKNKINKRTVKRNNSTDWRTDIETRTSEQRDGRTDWQKYMQTVRLTSLWWKGPDPGDVWCLVRPICRTRNRSTWSRG